MSDSPVIEPFIPPSPSTFLPTKDNEPPRLPTSEMQFIQPPHDPSQAIGWWNPREWRIPTSPWEQTQFFPPQAVPQFQPTPVLRLHRHLCYNLANHAAFPELLWDLIHPPDFARVRDLRHARWTKPDLGADAFQPSVKKVWVFSDHPVLSYWIVRWGHIIIESERITVRDVLEGIYTYLRMPLTREDLRHINSVPGNRNSLRYARAQRATDSYEVDSVVLSSGYRRIDTIGGHRRFKGMHIIVAPDETWRLYLGLLPGPVPRVPQ